MLRYQNKYRTVLRRCPNLVEEVSQELRAEGLPCPELEDHQEELIQPDNVAMANLLAEPAVHAMLEGLKELLRRASRRRTPPRSSARWTAWPCSRISAAFPGSGTLTTAPLISSA